jgi:hypothetical protein
VKIKQQRGWAMLLIMAIAWWQAIPAWAITELRETAPPAIITQLNQVAATAPQVSILSPRPEEVINSTDVTVQLQVTGTPIFKNSALGLGPHVHLLLDRVPTQSVYDLNAPLTLSNLTPGTHTLQVLANKPWHESWKNPTAFAQVTFHVITKSATSPNAQATQLVTVPLSQLGAEPFLLDFYLVNPPSHFDSQHPLRPVNDWRINVTINENSFVVDRWQPFYLQGLRPGNNLLKLEYLNAQGQLIDSAIRVIKYQPNGIDSLSQLLRNELTIERAIALLDPQRLPVAALPTITPLATTNPVIPTPAPVVLPSPIVQTPAPAISVVPIPASPQPIVSAPIVPASPVVPTPSIVVPVNPIVQTPVLSTPIPANPIAQTPALTNPIPVNPIVPSPAIINPLPTPAFTPQPTVQVAPPAPSIIPVPVPAVGQTTARSPQPKVDEVVELRVIWRELTHTISVRIKEFTNQIPPYVAQRSKDFGNWLSNRMAAMGQPAKSSAKTT